VVEPIFILPFQKGVLPKVFGREGFILPTLKIPRPPRADTPFYKGGIIQPVQKAAKRNYEYTPHNFEKLF